MPLIACQIGNLKCVYDYLIGDMCFVSLYDVVRVAVTQGMCNALREQTFLQ